MNLPLHDASLWPLLMTKQEVAHVTRRSTRTIDRKIAAGTFPEPTSDGMWTRDEVAAYCQGGIRKFDEDRKRAQLRMVGGRR